MNYEHVLKPTPADFENWYTQILETQLWLTDRDPSYEHMVEVYDVTVGELIFVERITYAEYREREGRWIWGDSDRELYRYEIIRAKTWEMSQLQILSRNELGMGCSTKNWKVTITDDLLAIEFKLART